MYVPKAPCLGGNTLMKLGKPGPDGLLPPYNPAGTTGKLAESLQTHPEYLGILGMSAALVRDHRSTLVDSARLGSRPRLRRNGGIA